MNRLDQARDSLEQALKADPGNPDHYLDLSTILSNQGETEMAIRVIAKGLQHRVEKNRLQVQMGLLYEKSGDYGEAERWYQTALKTEGTTTPAYVALARLLLATERRKEALDLLADATRSFPNDPLLEYMYR